MLIKSDYATLPFTEDRKKSVDEISFRINLTPFYPFFFNKKIVTIHKKTYKQKSSIDFQYETSFVVTNILRVGINKFYT